METLPELLNELAIRGVKLSVEADRLNCYSKKGVLTRNISDAIARHKTHIVRLLADTRVPPDRAAASVERPNVTEFPLSTGQRGLYVLQEVHPGTSCYNIPLCL